MATSISPISCLICLNCRTVRCESLAGFSCNHENLPPLPHASGLSTYCHVRRIEKIPQVVDQNPGAVRKWRSASIGPATPPRLQRVQPCVPVLQRWAARACLSATLSRLWRLRRSLWRQNTCFESAHGRPWNPCYYRIAAGKGTGHNEIPWLTIY